MHTRDLAADLVIRHLVMRGVQFLRLDTDTLGSSERHFGFSDYSPKLLYDGKEIYSDAVSAVWARRFSRPTSLQAVDARYASFVSRELRDTMEAFLDSVSGISVNNYEADRKAGNRLRQSMLAKAVGLAVPSTLVTQQRSAAEEFRDEGSVIAKAISYGSLDATENTVAYTTEVSQSKFEGLERCPVLLQRNIPKRREWRVTTVGRKVFSACTRADVDVDSNDWRRTKEVGLIFERGNFPEDMQGLLLDLCEKSGILFGAHDLIETPDGDFIFLETNPAGQWGWLEIALGLSIGEAVANLLCGLQE